MHVYKSLLTGLIIIMGIYWLTRDYCRICNLLQVMFTITSEQMMLFDTKWYIPTSEYKVFVGGQQPNQKTAAPSNVLDGSFTVQG